MDQRTNSLVITCLVLFSFCSASSLASLTSESLVVGDWRLSLGCKSPSIVSELFPPRRTVEPLQQTKPCLPPNILNSDCQLSIYPNGTFAILPSRLPQTFGSLGAAPCSQEDEFEHNTLLAMRGRWQLRKNPYCVTDRSFDDLTLLSFERVQRNTRTDDILQRVQLELHCQLRGRHTRGGLWRRLTGDQRYHRGRLTRGVILLRQVNNSTTWSRWMGHKTIGSFRALRHIPSDFQYSFDETDICNTDYVAFK